MIRLTRAQVREVDRRAIEEYHIPGIVLMENASRNAAAAAIDMSHEHKSAVIVCGGGNNGGDGYAIARQLHNIGWDIDIVRATDKPYKGDALTNYKIVQAMNLHIAESDDAEIFIRHAHDLIIDAIFGTGLTSAPTGIEKDMIDLINESHVPILSIDVPSGLDCDTGLPVGPSCVRATRTITFVAEKTGFANPESKQFTGELIVGDIGCPRELIEAIARAG